MTSMLTIRGLCPHCWHSLYTHFIKMTAYNVWNMNRIKIGTYQRWSWTPSRLVYAKLGRISVRKYEEFVCFWYAKNGTKNLDNATNYRAYKFAHVELICMILIGEATLRAVHCVYLLPLSILHINIQPLNFIQYLFVYL